MSLELSFRIRTKIKMLLTTALICFCTFYSFALFAEENPEAITSDAAIQANFSYQQTCIAYPKYRFIDMSKGQHDSCIWYFGDGNTSKKCIDSHVFHAPGRYDVKLVISGTFGNSTVVQQVEITDQVSPIEAEIFFHQVPSRPYEVVFSYKSTGGFKGSIENQQWDFGDGYTDDRPSPAHSDEKNR